MNYRVFDTKKNQYVPKEYILIDGYGNFLNNSLENCSFNPKNWKLELSSTKFDNNGNELFENDIIKLLSSEGYPFYTIKFIDAKFVAEAIAPFGNGKRAVREIKNSLIFGNYNLKHDVDRLP